MRYLTHSILHALSRDSKPERQRRDNFGINSAGCWCGRLTSPAVIDGPTHNIDGILNDTPTSTPSSSSTVYSEWSDSIELAVCKRAHPTSLHVLIDVPCSVPTPRAAREHRK